MILPPLPIIVPIAVSFSHVPQILKGILKGASQLLPALRVLSSLLSSCSDSVLLYSFCQEAGLPGLRKLVRPCPRTETAERDWVELSGRELA